MATEAGRGATPLLSRLSSSPPLPPPRSRQQPLSFDPAAARHHGRRSFSSSNVDAGGDDEKQQPHSQQPPRTTATTTATSIADALRLPRDSLARLDLSGGGSAADLRCVNLLCERVGRGCVCRLSLALGKVAERQGRSLAELSLARNGLDELPGAVWVFGGKGGDGGSGGSENNPPPAPPSFRALRRIDLSGNPGLKEVRGIIGRGGAAAAAMPALREVLVDRGVRVVVDEEGEGEEKGGGGEREGGQAVEVVEV